MTGIRITDDNLLPALLKFSWILLITLTIAGSLLKSGTFGISILTGGIVALGNSYWLRNILQRILIQQRSDAASYAMLRFILRYLILAIAVLMALKLGADIAGLLIGLSVMVIATMFFSIYSAMQRKGD